jgi:hypothetical protein
MSAQWEYTPPEHGFDGWWTLRLPYGWDYTVDRENDMYEPYFWHGTDLVATGAPCATLEEAQASCARHASEMAERFGAVK